MTDYEQKQREALEAMAEMPDDVEFWKRMCKSNEKLLKESSDVIIRQNKEITTLRSKLEAAEKALDFYATGKHFKQVPDADGVVELCTDCGYTAHYALSQIRDTKPTTTKE